MLNVLRNHKAYWGRGGGGGGGGEKQMSGSTWKIEEAVDHCQNNNYVKAVGTSPLCSN